MQRQAARDAAVIDHRAGRRQALGENHLVAVEQAELHVMPDDGVRVVAFTFETPTGQPQFYAKKETLGLDLRHPYFRTVESYDNDGKIFEKIVFESITPKTFDDSTFDPKNKAYKF